MQCEGLLHPLSAAELTGDDLDLIRISVEPEQILTVWLGSRVTTDIGFDLQLSGDALPGVAAIERLLQDRAIIPGAEP